MTPPPKTMGQTDNCAQAQYNHLTENIALLIACIQDNHANEHLYRGAFTIPSTKYTFR